MVAESAVGVKRRSAFLRADKARTHDGAPLMNRVLTDAELEEIWVATIR